MTDHQLRDTLTLGTALGLTADQTRDVISVMAQWYARHPVATFSWAQIQARVARRAAGQEWRPRP